MAPKIPSVISCSSTVLLEHELSVVRSGLELTETEDSWEKISNAILRLNALTVGSAADYPSQLIVACKSFVRSIINSLNSERSRLSGCATDLLSSLATHLRCLFETLIPLFVPSLLSLASRSNKIFIARAKACLMTIVENVQSPAILPLLRHAVSDKSVTLRLTAIDLVVACLNCYNPPDLEAPNRVEDIEAVIRATARDASADVRKSSRKAFEAYKILFPSRVDTFIAPLTPKMRKYLDIKVVPAGQRKPLLLSTSTSAPAQPSSTKLVDALSRSHSSAQGHAKSSSTSSAAASRTDRAGKSTKPPINAPVAESNSMPPPPQRIPSSGPVRPPLSMRQAVAAASSMPSRKLLSRHALQTSGASSMDLSKSQPLSYSGAQRPAKTPTPPTVSPALDVAQPAPKYEGGELSGKERSKTGPRRVPKPEPASVFSAPDSAVIQKHHDSLKDSTKETERERALLASSTSSTTSTSTHTAVHARSRPPSRLASSTSSRVGEEKGREKDIEQDRESWTRPASRMGGEFRPRPVSRTENGVHKAPESEADKMLQARPASRTDREFRLRPASRTENEPHKPLDSKADNDLHTRPPSRAEGNMHARPASRAEKRPRSRTESRAEHPNAVRPSRKPVEQQEQIRAGPQPQAPTKHEEAKKLPEERVETRPSSKKTKESKTGRSKPEKKKRKGGNPGTQGKLQESEERFQFPTSASHDAQTSDALNDKDASTPKAATSEHYVEQNVHEPEPASRSQSPPHPSEQKPSQDTVSKNNGATTDVGLSGTTRIVPIIAENVEDSENVKSSKEVDVLAGQTPKAQIPTTPPPKRNGGLPAKQGVKPLVIHKASAGSGSIAHPESQTSSEYEVTPIAACEVPLPPSPPFAAYRPADFEFVTPVPLRQATAALKYQVAATPISSLLVSIQRGFDMDCSVIGEESEGDVTLSGLRPHNILQGVAEEGEEEAEELAPGVEGAECFIDIRPRKLAKKEHNGRAEERLPLAPRAENC